MLKRILAGLAALVIVLPPIYLGGWYFVGLMAFAGAVCLVEFMNMTLKGDLLAKYFLTAMGTSLIILMLSGTLASAGGVAIISLVVVAILVYFLFKTGDMKTVAERASMGIAGIFWAGLLLGVTGCLRLLPDGTNWLLLTCMLAWGSDTGAYFSGRFLGKKKLYEKISPKKTWAGAIGGVITATAGAFIMREITGPQIPTPHLLIIAPIGAALGQIGDLSESMLKRSVGVKDSGRIMPGHGGLLDRVDALIFIGPPLLAYATLVLNMNLKWVAL